MDNKENKPSVLFFGSGDFPIPTFKKLLSDGYRISGLVTSKDKNFFEKERLTDIATQAGIPVYTTANADELELAGWIDSHPADIFCVISFKFLRREIVEKAGVLAFNVHASLLPFLRGSNPISWAIMNSFSETGLTAFVLGDKIDCGNIIDNIKTEITADDNYGSLHSRLSAMCPSFTENVIDEISSGNYRTLTQPLLPPEEKDKHLFIAPKTDSEFMTIPEHSSNAQFLLRKIKALVPRWPFRITLEIYNEPGPERSLVKSLDLNIYNAEIRKIKRDALNENSRVLHTDFKTYVCFFEGRFEEDALFLTEMQQPGKKILSVADFLRGIQYIIKENPQAFIEIRQKK